MSIAVHVILRRHREKKKLGKRRQKFERARSDSSLPEPQLNDEDRAFIKGLMNKYDLSGNRLMDYNDLKRMLVDMNDGEDVLDTEVRAVMKAADTNNDFHLTEANLLPAVEAWYQIHDQQAKCCTIS